MTIDEAIRDLLDVSTDIRSVAIFDDQGNLVGYGPGAVSIDAGAAVAGLWEAAARYAQALGDVALDHVVVPEDTGVVAIVAHGGRRIAAHTGLQPPVGLLLFDLRTCLNDAFPEE